VILRDGRLFGYVTSQPGAVVDGEALRGSLGALLPAHMVPAAIAVLDALPLTINGKVDRRALPDVRVSAGAVAPRDHYEALLQTVWQDVMGIASIGVEDDFFALGGHSLLAMRLIAACGEVVGASLPLRLVLEGPTIAAMAAAVRTGAAAASRGGLVRLRRGTAANALFCLHPAFGHAVGYAGLAKAYPGDGAVYGLQCAGLEPGETLEGSVESMAARYIETMRAEVPVGPYRLLGFSSGGTVGFEIARQLTAAGERVAMLGLLDTSAPRSLSYREETEAEIWFEMAGELGWDVRTFPKGAFASRDAMIAAAAELGLLRGELAVEHMRRMVTVRRNNIVICSAYEPQPWAGPAVLVRALRRPGPKVDWSPWIVPPPAVIELDCLHDDLIRPEMAETIMEQIAPFFSA
jgi:thioesterase domain-containing protein